MEMLLELWLPILLATGLVFLASFLSWMLLPFHKREWATFEDEGRFLARLEELGVSPGKYMFPRADAAEADQAAFQERWKRGPHGILHVWPRAPSFGRNLALTFGFYLLTSVFVAYLASTTLGHDASYGAVFRVTGVAAILAYTFASIPNAIWFQKPLAAILADVFDGIVFGLLTAGAFAGFWPGA